MDQTFRKHSSYAEIILYTSTPCEPGKILPSALWLSLKSLVGTGAGTDRGSIGRELSSSFLVFLWLVRHSLKICLSDFKDNLKSVYLPNMRMKEGGKGLVGFPLREDTFQLFLIERHCGNRIRISDTVEGGQSQSF